MMRWTPAIVGGMWLITWGFWLAGYHTPMTFAASLVGCTGFALVWGTVVDNRSNKRSR